MAISHRVILDTDIGSDVDDALALAQLLGTLSVDLVGVTTVYGDTRLRARLASRLARAAGRKVDVYAGRGETLSGRQVWWAGHEGALHDDLAEEPVAEGDAVAYLVEQVRRHPQELDIVAIGPLTNVAAAIGADPEFGRGVRHLWVMGGDFDSDEPEHNLSSDVDAAQVVFSSGMPTTVSGLNVTRFVHIDRGRLDRIAAAGRLGELLLAEVRQWWRYTDTESNVPHDPVAVLTMLEPEHFRFSPPGRVRIDADGRSRFTEGGGSTRIVRTLDAEVVADRIVAAIVAGGVGDAGEGGG